MSALQNFDALPEYTQAVWQDGKVVNAADPIKWGGRSAPPAVGANVKVYMNGLGNGTVVRYFVQEGWLGVLIKLDSPPDWYTKQNNGNPLAHLFGPELEPFKKKEG